MNFLKNNACSLIFPLHENREGAMNFLKNNACSLIFPLHENRDGHLAGLMEA